jgi:hypothetical protein
MLFPENGIMSNLTCLPDAHREVTENQTLQAGDKEAIDGRLPTGTTRPIEGPQPRLDDLGVGGIIGAEPVRLLGTYGQPRFPVG